MAVYIETTTVSKILKFVSDKLLTKESFEYSSKKDASNSPLALALLQFPFIKKVYITANFIAIEKMDTVKWENVVEELKIIVNDHIAESKVFIGNDIQIPISIYAEMTPNPEVMKFVSNIILLDGILEIKSKEDSLMSPISSQLFIFPFVKEIFITENYISITKDSSVEWNEISLELRDEISSLLRNDIPVVRNEVGKSTLKTREIDAVSIIDNREFTSDEEAIHSLLDEYVKPAVVADGGNIQLIKYLPETKTVQVLLQGACSGCPSSTVTLKNGIETMLKQFLPNKINSVEAING